MTTIITDDRIAHMHKVAEYMYAHAKDYGLEHEKEQIYVLGLLHDVGAIRGSENHAYSGYDMLRMMNLSQKWLAVINTHSMSPTKYCKYYGINRDAVPPIQILMWDADMHYGPAGEYMTWEECAAKRQAEWNKIGKDVNMNDVLIFLKEFGRTKD